MHAPWHGHICSVLIEYESTPSVPHSPRTEEDQRRTLTEDHVSRRCPCRTVHALKRIRGGGGGGGGTDDELRAVEPV